MPTALDTERIVTASVIVLDRHGADGFSMRKLGEQLGVDPMAVYHYVPNKGALFDLLVDRVWQNVEALTPDADASWQEQASATMVALRTVLLEHPALVGVLAQRSAVTTAMLRVVDDRLGGLSRAGLAHDSAMTLLDCLVAYTLGKVGQEVRAAAQSEQQQVQTALADVGPASHPHLSAAVGAGYTWAPQEQFARGLEALIRGW